MTKRSVAVRIDGFQRRAAKFIVAIYGALNGGEFVDLGDIADPTISDEIAENVAHTMNVLGNLKYVESMTSEDGKTLYRLTPDGVVQKSIYVKDVQ